MLRLANGALHALHLGVIVFSVVGWIAPATRPFHLILAACIALSWFALGPLLGEPGYCALTGAQHAIWRKLGRNEDRNYMSFLAETITGREPDVGRVACVTQWTFYATTSLSIALTALER